MTSRLLILTSLWLLAALAAHAQIPYENAADFFNGGAQFYISNNIPDALKRTEAGMKIYPDDVKLKELEKLLKQQQQQQQQQNQQNQQQNKSQNQSQSQNQQQQNKQQQQKNSERKQQKQQNQANKQNQQKQQEQQAQEAQAMTPEEAKRLLDAQKENEQLLQFKPQNQPQNANSPIKDW